MARCTGITKKGEPCCSNAKKGTDRCGSHPDTADTATRTRTERWSRERWLDLFEWTGLVSDACEMLGVGRSTVYDERQRNEEFAIAWSDVELRSTERMEAEAYRRAVHGVTTPMVSAGVHVTDVQSYSDRLLEFMLKARKPEKYRDRVDVNHSGRIEKRVKIDLARLDDDELDALDRIAAKLEEPVAA
jgi:hypothetical protein